MEPKQQCCQCGRNRINIIEKLRDLKTWMGQDSDLLVFQRFEALSLRNLLFLQHDLTDIERKLEELDKICTTQDSPTYDALILQARSLLSSYHEAFLTYQRMKSLPNTPGYVLRVLEESNAPIVESFRCEQNVCDKVVGSSSVVATEKGVVHQYIDSQYWMTKLLAQIENPRQKSSIYHYSEKLLWYIDQFVINCCVVALVAIPIVVLTFVPNTIGRLLAVLGFVVVAAPFTSMISSKYLKNSNLPFMLGYAAILVAFLSQTSGPSSHA